MSKPSDARIRKAVAELSSLLEFPRRAMDREAIGRLIGRCCRDDVQVDALIEKLLFEGLYDHWPGPATLVRIARQLLQADANTEAERMIEQWKRELAEKDGGRECTCVAGMVRLQDGAWVRCTCAMGARVTDQALELSNVPRGPQAAGLTRAGNPGEYEEWLRRGEIRNRELEKERAELRQRELERRAAEAADESETVQ